MYKYNAIIKGVTADVAIDHQPLKALEKWKVCRYRLLWVAGQS